VPSRPFTFRDTPTHAHARAHASRLEQLLVQNVVDIDMPAIVATTARNAIRSGVSDLREEVKEIAKVGRRGARRDARRSDRAARGGALGTCRG
jgi:hypothetical protein